LDSLERHRFDLEAETSRKTNRAEKTKAIFAEAAVGIADRAYEFRVQIGPATDVIKNFTGFRIEQESVDREVSPQDIVPGIGFEVHAFRMPPILVFMIAAKGGHLDLRVPIVNQHHSKVSTHLTGSRKQTQEIVRRGGSGYIEIDWGAAHEKIAHTPACEKSYKAGLP
jgi:hypothetical protein